MLNLFILLPVSYAVLCSQLDVGTDITALGNVIKSGVVQPGWFYHDASYKSSPAESEIYFYVKGLDLLGPTFEVQEFHHEDEKNDDDHKWLFMNVSIDEKIDGIFKDYTAYKVIQQCVDRDGGSTLRVNVTFKAFTCDPITFNWIKVCGEPMATQETLMIGLREGGSDIVMSGVVTPQFDGNIKSNIYVVSSKTKNITFYAYMTDSFIRAFYKEPYIITDHEVLYPTISGSLAKSGWIEGDLLDLTITFNCLVDDGKNEELILVIELPYFHDLEIHFFKVCGVVEVSSSYWSYLFYLGIISGLLLLGYLAYNYMKENELDFSGVYQKALSLCKETSTGLVSKGETSMKDMDDDGKQGLNVHTLYGTA